MEDAFDLFTPGEMRELEFVFLNYLCHCLKGASGGSSPWSWFGVPACRGGEALRWEVSGACSRGYGQCTMVSGNCHFHKNVTRIHLALESRLVFLHTLRNVL